MAAGRWLLLRMLSMFVCVLVASNTFGIRYLWRWWVLHRRCKHSRSGPQVFHTWLYCTVCFAIRTLHGLPNINLVGIVCGRCLGLPLAGVHCACASWTLDFDFSLYIWTNGKGLISWQDGKSHDSSAAAVGCDGEAQRGEAESRASMDLSCRLTFFLL